MAGGLVIKDLISSDTETNSSVLLDASQEFLSNN